MPRLRKGVVPDASVLAPRQPVLAMAGAVAIRLVPPQTAAAQDNSSVGVALARTIGLLDHAAGAPEGAILLHPDLGAIRRTGVPPPGPSGSQ